MRHNRNCHWVVEPGVAYCPACLQPVILEEEVPDQTEAPSISADDLGPDNVTCQTCGRQVVPSADGTCPWDGQPLLQPGPSATPSVSAPNGYRVSLGATPLTLGRLSADERFGTAVDADGVSRRHASLRIDAEGVVWLSDLGSTNGTWLAGRRIVTESRLPSGESQIGLGKAVTVSVHVP